ncbi:MAG: transposase [Lyngbya sp.]|nr:transposase [Lyngbya sp.]
MGQPLRELLQTPLHLKLFLEVAAPGEVFTSLQALLAKLWSKWVVNPDGVSGRSELLELLANRISSEEEFWLPTAIAEDTYSLACRALEQAEILTLRLTATQQATIDQWIELARRQYNYRLAERFNWYEQNRCDIDACPLICHLPELKDRPDFYSQKRDLVNSKTLFPEYKAIPSHTLQDVMARVEKTFDQWLSGDSNGKRSGKPRFKGQGRFRSIAFRDPIKPEHIQGRFVKLPKIGKLKLIWHRPLPDGFKVKTAAIIKKVDGYYITLSLQDSTVPVLSPDAPEMDNTIGIDMGLKSFLVDDSGEEIQIPQHYRKSEKQLQRLQRFVSRKKKGSNRRKKAIKRLSRKHLKVSNQRKDFHHKTAKKL